MFRHMIDVGFIDRVRGGIGIHAQGNLNQRFLATLNTFLDLPDHTGTSTFNINSTSWHSLPHHSLPSDVDWEALKPHFG